MLTLAFSAIVITEGIIMDMEDFGRRAIPMVVRMNTRNAIRIIKFIKKMDLHAKESGPATHVYTQVDGHGHAHQIRIPEPEPHHTYHHHSGHHHHHGHTSHFLGHHHPHFYVGHNFGEGLNDLLSWE